MFDTYQPGAAMEIRSWSPEHKSGGTALTVQGRELPLDVGAIHIDGFRILTLAPGEWLLASDAQSPSAIHQQLAAELAGQGAVLVDVTDGLGALELRGSLARELLSKGCGLDFHPSAFPVGRCARTRFAQMSAIIEHVDAAPSFHIYVARSYRRYLSDWLADAAVEFTHESV
jgi:sarcosine oxidase subunit gamma